MSKSGLLTKDEAVALQREIERNYSPEVQFGPCNNDIRTRMYNYDNPVAEITLNGVNLRVVAGLIEGEPYNRRKTYLLYRDGEIIGKFYSASDAMKSVKYLDWFGGCRIVKCSKI